MRVESNRPAVRSGNYSLGSQLTQVATDRRCSHPEIGQDRSSTLARPLVRASLAISDRLASDSRMAIAPPPTNPGAYLETNVLVANSAACRSASTILPASAMPLPAISKAVP